MKNRYSVKAIIRDDKPIKQNGKYPINLLIRINGKPLKVHLNIDIEVKYWNKKSGCVQKGCPEYKFIKALIDKERNSFYEFMSNQELAGRLVTRELAKMFFDNAVSSNSFISFVENYIQENNYRYSPNTLKGYRTLLNHLKIFRKDLKFYDIDLEFLNGFKKYLFEKGGNSDGGAHTKLKNLRAIVNDAIKKGLIQTYPFRNFKMPKLSNRLTYLTQGEIKILEILEIPENMGRLERVRDMFLFSCYAGHSYIDLQNLRWTYKLVDDSGIMTYKRQKTGSFVRVPLTDKAKALLQKYEGEKGGFVFPRISDQKYNEYLKELAVLAGIDKVLTTHVGRHTFATTLVNNQIDIALISKMMGHSSLATTQIYAKVNDEGMLKAMLKVA